MEIDMRINYIILILLLAVIITPVMGAEKKLETLGTKGLSKSPM